MVPLELGSGRFVVLVQGAQVLAVQLVAILQLGVLRLHVFLVFGLHVLHELLVLFDHLLQLVQVVGVAILLFLNLEGQGSDVAFLLRLAGSIQSVQLRLVRLSKFIHQASVGVHFGRMVPIFSVHCLQVGLLGVGGLLMQIFDLGFEVCDFAN